MTAINSLLLSAVGPTWYHTRGHSACIDYIVIPVAMVHQTLRAHIARRLGYFLQLAETSRLADHVPTFGVSAAMVCMLTQGLI